MEDDWRNNSVCSQSSDISPIKSKSADSSRSDKSFNLARTKSTESPRNDKSIHSSHLDRRLASSKASKSVHSSRSDKNEHSSRTRKSASSSKSDKSTHKSHNSSHSSRSDRSTESVNECIYVSNSSEDSPVKKRISQAAEKKPETSSKPKLKLKSLKMDGSLDKWMDKMKENKHIATSSNVSTNVLFINRANNCKKFSIFTSRLVWP